MSYKPPKNAELEKLWNTVTKSDWASGPNVMFDQWTKSKDELVCIYFCDLQEIHIYRKIHLEEFKEGERSHDYNIEKFLEAHKVTKDINVLNYLHGAVGVSIDHSLNRIVRRFIADTVGPDGSVRSWYRSHSSRRRRSRRFVVKGEWKACKYHTGHGAYDSWKFHMEELFAIQETGGQIVRLEKLYEIDLAKYMRDKNLPGIWEFLESIKPWVLN